MKLLNNLTNGLGSLLFPHSCVLCGLRTGGAARYPLCPACQGNLPRICGPLCPRCGRPLLSALGLCMSCRKHDYSFDAAIVLFHYTGPVKTLLSAYKGYGRRSIAIFIAEQMYTALKTIKEPFILVPVPPRPGKILRQGWDQTRLIVQLLHSRYRLPASTLLRRLRGGRQQKKLSAQDRMLNMRRRFVLRKAVPANTLLVLVDDILTTGATISACADALKQGGALRVQACLFAAD